jgi:DNA-3-methyladenine glycosylase II
MNRRRRSSAGSAGGTLSTGATDGRAVKSYALRVQAPYRLDLTVNALRRLSSNRVDVLTPDGEYLRVLGDVAEPAVVRARQPSPGTISIVLEGDRREHPRLLARVRRMLGLEVDLTRFYHAASGIQWLHPLVLRMRGVRPPRYPTLWEACVNAIVFQQVSLIAASTIMGRFTTGLGEPVERGGVRLYRFPGIEQVQRAPDRLLRAAGLSAAKLATLRRVADALEKGPLNEVRMEETPSPEAAALLRGIKGIGPWTAAVILLRGLGRLDVFPANDSSVARNLALVGGSASRDVAAVLEALGPERGMLYYHLLLARLEAGASLGRVSASAHQSTRRSGA